MKIPTVSFIYSVDLYKFMEEKRFIDREEELAALLAALSRKGAELIILYGRRRIGKSRLLKEAAKKTKIDVSVMLEEADYSINLKKFGDAVARQFKFPSFSPTSFREAFSALPDNSVVILDEYSYIPKSAGEFQAIWEEIIKPKGIKLVLSGSLIRIMEDLNYSLESPLYGRATKIIKLTSLPFIYVRRWYENAATEDVINTYFSVGGIPRYLEIIEKPTISSIKETFFSKDGLLLREGKLLLKESFPASVLIPRILFSVASGISEASKIADSIQIKANEIGKYLAMLSDYGFVEKKYPIVGGGKKDVRFYVADRFFSFWARFIWPHYSDIEAGASKQAIDEFERNFRAFSGHEFERLVIETMQMFPSIVPFQYNAIGRQWGRIPTAFNSEKGKNQYEIDVCALNETKKEIFFCECKWQDNVDAKKILAELREKAKYVDWNNGKRKEHYAIFVKSFKEKIKEPNVALFNLEDFSAILKKI